MNEEEVTAMLNHLGSQLPVVRAPVNEVLASGKKSRRRRQATQTVGVCAAVAVVAVGGFALRPDPGGSSPTTGPRHATSPRASASDPATPSPIEQCRAADIGITLGRDGAYHNLSSRIISFANTAHANCRLEGADIGIDLRTAAAATSVDMTGVKQLTLLLRPGHSADLLIGSPGSCARAKAVPGQLDVDVNGGRRAHLVVPRLPMGCGNPKAIDFFNLPGQSTKQSGRCHDHGGLSAPHGRCADPPAEHGPGIPDQPDSGTVAWDDRVDYEKWEPPLPRGQDGWPTEPPSRWPDLGARLLLPQAVRPGETVDYLVVLRNVSDDAVDLRPCGGYRQEVLVVGAGMAAESVNGGESAFRLNCDAAPILLPAESRRYAMRLVVPDGVTGDEVLFTWGLLDNMPDYEAQEWIRLSTN